MVSAKKEIALKRLKIRSWRRGTKEMDLILGKFSDANLRVLSQSDLEVYDKMLDENDNDLYNWCSKKNGCSRSLSNVINENYEKLNPLLTVKFFLN